VTNLKDLLTQAGYRVKVLADEMHKDYGRVYTAIDMDAKGLVPKRKSVIELQGEIRSYLELSLRGELRTLQTELTEEEVESDTAKLRKRVSAWTVSADFEVSLDWNGWSCGDPVRLDIDGVGEWEWYKFLRHVLNTRNGKAHVEVCGGPNGGFRCRTPDILPVRSA